MTVYCPRCGSQAHRSTKGVVPRWLCCDAWSEVEETARLRYLLPRLTHAMGTRCLDTVELGALLRLCRTQVELEARRGR